MSIKFASSLLAIIVLAVPTLSQEDWLKRSDLVFQGEVLKLHASTVDLPDRSEVGLVRVTEIIEGSNVLRDYLQQPITVKFKDIKDVKPGQKAIFYGNLWMSGRGIAITEIGMKRLDSGDSSAKQKEEITKDRAKIQENSLKSRLDDADQVVVGRVVSTRLLPVTTKESEHDPMWTEAEIAVDEGLKGNVQGGTRIKITFAASKDIMWVRAPKFVRGEAGVWILKRDIDIANRPPNFVVIDRAQFIEMNRRDEIRRLLR